MGHITSKDAYKNLEERINWFTQGAPPSDSLSKILQILYTETEAKWGALTYIGLGTCYCRHKMLHAGHPCEINAPLDVCLTFGNVARSLAVTLFYYMISGKLE
jgi:hypothetical protein